LTDNFDRWIFDLLDYLLDIYTFVYTFVILSKVAR
jgi:hypothetical protein